MSGWCVSGRGPARVAMPCCLLLLRLLSHALCPRLRLLAGPSALERVRRSRMSPRPLRPVTPR
eukprot:3208403-Rhodomonas_salina.1